jgi:hypothetical protein
MTEYHVQQLPDQLEVSFSLPKVRWMRVLRWHRAPFCASGAHYAPLVMAANG